MPGLSSALGALSPAYCSSITWIYHQQLSMSDSTSLSNPACVPSSLDLSCPGLPSPHCADGEASALHSSFPLAFMCSWSDYVKTAHLSTPFSLRLPTRGASLHAHPSPVSSKTRGKSPQLSLISHVHTCPSGSNAKFSSGSCSSLRIVYLTLFF